MSLMAWEHWVSCEENSVYEKQVEGIYGETGKNILITIFCWCHLFKKIIYYLGGRGSTASQFMWSSISFLELQKGQATILIKIRWYENSKSWLIYHCCVTLYSRMYIANCTSKNYAIHYYVQKKNDKWGWGRDKFPVLAKNFWKRKGWQLKPVICGRRKWS